MSYRHYDPTDEAERFVVKMPPVYTKPCATPEASKKPPTI